MMETLIFMWCPAQLILLGWVMDMGGGGCMTRLQKSFVTSKVLSILILSPTTAA